MSKSPKTTKTNKGGKRTGSGRKSREELGLVPLIHTSIRVEKSVIERCRIKHGSLVKALRKAADMD